MQGKHSVCVQRIMDYEAELEAKANRLDVIERNTKKLNILYGIADVLTIEADVLTIENDEITPQDSAIVVYFVTFGRKIFRFV